MASKVKVVFVCTSCGAESPKWYGKCPGCNEWNTMNEEVRTPVSANTAAKRQASASINQAIRLYQINPEGEQRYVTGYSELDRVLGGGIVKGSLVLLGGDPGIGKSTMLMQVCGELGRTLSILYVSGEESQRQLKLRADRLSIHCDGLMILAETNMEDIVDQIHQIKPDLVMIDSIQTMNIATISSSPGSVTQVRESTNLLMHTAKGLDIPIFLVGHVNKDGAIAGPKVLEHIVDAVLYFEGERNLSYRILRAVKNRYGSTNEIGVFEMRESGLAEVPNPSLMLLSGRPKNVSGTCVACIMEGSRPILAEVQALVTPSGFGNPRRTSTGFDYNRMSLMLAVLEKRAGYFFANQDAYINVVGGLRLDETAADLTVALALVSSLKDITVAEGILAFGEIGLGGEIRAVGRIESRIAEAARLGFTKCILPKHNLKSLNQSNFPAIELIGVRSVREAVLAAL